MNVDENIIAVCGPVDAGKSSLIGVLTTVDTLTVHPSR